MIEKRDGDSAPLILGRPFIQKDQIKMDVDDDTRTIKDLNLKVCFNLFHRATMSAQYIGRKWKSSFGPS